MTLLGIETSTAVCSAALVTDGIVVRESLLDEGRVHAEALMGQIAEVIGPGGAGALGGVAVSIGPGSFTGLRIGVSVAKGIAYARGVPIAGVPTLGALARHAALTDNMKPGTRLLAALDARRDEVYCQLFDVTDAGTVACWDVRDMTLAALEGELRGGPVRVTGDGAAKVLAHAGAGSLLGAVSPEANRCSAASVAILGERRLAAGEADELSALEPRYIKDFFLKTR
ncbi:MAG TPA: tRNA (adenosine(37)-N6)-threonylcarbamoyltransferase complex dimerization subunit type 1 TsaB [Bacteroidota bacterium]|nr:tRNA (adenosine(37)-N6)-threonylcarbamoyltransferase complex dimerization subunit type 1 TsaB [Bacteroidota bacterium]